MHHVADLFHGTAVCDSLTVLLSRVSMSTGLDEAVEFGQRFLPFSFTTYHVKLPRHWWIWKGFVHAFVRQRGCFMPIARVLRGPSTWQHGPATEPVTDLALTAIDEFTSIPDYDDAAVDEFTGYDSAEAA